MGKTRQKVGERLYVVCDMVSTMDECVGLSGREEGKEKGKGK